MILIITRKDDVHVDLVAKRFKEEKIDFFRLNTECIYEYEINLTLSGGRLKNIITGKYVNLEDVRSIWLRRRSLPEQIKISNEFKSFVDQEWLCFQKNIWSCLEKRFWISSPNAIEHARNKLQQLSMARKLEFCVPETLFTNSLDDVIAFQESYGKCIYKPYDSGFLSPTSDKAIYTNIIESELVKSAELAERLRVCPGIFQPYIEKDYELRITVVGNRVFATKIDSQISERTKVDWRRYDFENIYYSAYQLPTEEEQQCVKLVKEFGLKFGAIDMIVTPNGKHYFLEINANGQWAWIETIAGQQISLEIAHLLIRHEN